MKYIVDRIEGEYAVCEAEDHSMVNIPLYELPTEVQEGSQLLFTDQIYEIIPMDSNRSERIQNLMDDLWN